MKRRTFLQGVGAMLASAFIPFRGGVASPGPVAAGHSNELVGLDDVAAVVQKEDSDYYLEFAPQSEAGRPASAVDMGFDVMRISSVVIRNDYQEVYVWEQLDPVSLVPVNREVVVTGVFIPGSKSYQVPVEVSLIGGESALPWINWWLSERDVPWYVVQDLIGRSRAVVLGGVMELHEQGGGVSSGARHPGLVQINWMGGLVEKNWYF